MLDRDGDCPWKLVERKASKKAGIMSERQRKYALEREGQLFAMSREDGSTTGGKVAHKGKYEMITVTADSGAADHVAPKEVANHLRVQETEASRQGMKYVAANGQKIANEGQKTIRGLTDEGMPLGMTWQVAEVKRPLASIGRMCDAGNVAVFTKGGGYVVPQQVMSKTLAALDQMENKSLKMEREGGVYNFKLWIPRPPVSSMSSNRFTPLQEVAEEDMGFTSRGREQKSCEWRKTRKTARE